MLEKQTITPVLISETALDKTIAKLTPYQTQEPVGKILELLRSSQDSKPNSTEVTEELRRLCAKLHTSASQEPTKTALAEAAYYGLLFLAERNPINTGSDECASVAVDLATFDKIADATRVLTSTGYQFDITTLVKYHNERACKHDEGEDHNVKQLRNPYTGAAFIARDVVQLQACAKTHGLAFQGLGTVESAHFSSHPTTHLGIDTSPPSLDSDSDEDEAIQDTKSSPISINPMQADENKRQLTILRGILNGEIKSGRLLLMSEARSQRSDRLIPSQTASREVREALFIGSPEWREVKFRGEVLTALFGNPQLRQAFEAAQSQIASLHPTYSPSPTTNNPVEVEQVDSSTEIPTRRCSIL